MSGYDDPEGFRCHGCERMVWPARGLCGWCRDEEEERRCLHGRVFLAGCETCDIEADAQA